ncbi:glycosyltransferase family 2 protein [Hymenobacter sp. J193]|uniref:glycosyltransferase n=1 Tax=Hymenobacter sp. J193 TaxID=2898429 RepID=UPI002151FCB6|nr:glycosyltransferase [Hymenobacter sp. J193]
MAFSLVFFSLFFGLCALVLVLVLLPRPALPRLTHLPRVSILVAARNEASTIERCLRSLAAMNYPVELLEILIGDDASTDDTMAVVQRFIADKPQFRLLPIRHRLGTAQGKSNVLAQLCRAATTDFFSLPTPTWPSTPAGCGPCWRPLPRKWGL